MDDAPRLPPRSIAGAATLACIWEASAPKPGNVHRGADFDDLTYMDMVSCAAIIGPIIQNASQKGVGAVILDGVRATKSAVGVNANLGILLLLAPLAAAAVRCTPSEGVQRVLNELDESDARDAYAAIRHAAPGGLGQVDHADVNACGSPDITLREAMHLAANRDLVARQYANGFAEVLTTADCVEAGIVRGWSLSDAIVRAYLELIAANPDTLIARKCGAAEARDASIRSRRVVAAGVPGQQAYHAAIADLDFHLRCDGNRRNPGASADVIAAALFVLLSEDRVNWPVRFYH